MFFLARYCKLLEENSFRGRTGDFFYMLLFGATVLTSIVFIGGSIPYISESFAKVLFLSNSLTFMMVSQFCLDRNIIYIYILFHQSICMLRMSPLLYTGVCLEQAQSFDSHEFFGPFHFHCSLFAMGMYLFFVWIFSFF